MRTYTLPGITRAHPSPEGLICRRYPKSPHLSIRQSRTLVLSPSNSSYPLSLLSQKCTYGNKCKYYHPERGNQPQKSVTEKLAEHAQRSLQGRRGLADGSPGKQTRPVLSARYGPSDLSRMRPIVHVMAAVFPLLGRNPDSVVVAGYRLAALRAGVRIRAVF